MINRIHHSITQNQWLVVRGSWFVVRKNLPLYQNKGMSKSHSGPPVGTAPTTAAYSRVIFHRLVAMP